VQLTLQLWPQLQNCLVVLNLAGEFVAAISLPGDRIMAQGAQPEVRRDWQKSVPDLEMGFSRLKRGRNFQHLHQPITRSRGNSGIG
jgi:hypothetical protein